MWGPVIAALLVQSILFFRWWYRRQREWDVMKVFVESMAMNHLPHIYSSLEKIARKLDVELDETPMVRFVDFNGRGKRHAG